MKSKLLFCALVGLIPSVSFGQAAPGFVNPASAALQAAPAAALDTSRIQDGDRFTSQIKSVDIQGVNYHITGELVANEDTSIRLYREFYQQGGATSMGGDPGLRCSNVTLGDAGDHNAPQISALANTAYKFSMDIVTHDGSREGLQELRMVLDTREGHAVVKFPKLMPDAPDTAAIPDATAAPAGVSAAPGVAGLPAAPTATDPTAGLPATPGDPTAGLALPGTPAAGTAATPAAATNAPTTPAAPTDPTATPAAVVGTPAAPAVGVAPAVAVAQAPVGNTLSPADAAARADIMALQASLAANQIKPSITHIQSLQANEKNGVSKTTMSPAMKAVADKWIAAGIAQVRMATDQAKINAFKPKNANDFIAKVRAELGTIC